MRSTSCSIFVSLLAAGVSALLFAGAAAAQANPPSRAADLYIGAAYGKAKAEKACAGLAGCEDTDNSFGAFAGYWLNSSFALEAGYHNLGSATAPGGTHVRSNAWELVAVGAWRGLDPLSLYFKLGAYAGAQEGGGTLQADKERVHGITYGAGAQLDVTKSLGLRGEWQNYPRMGGGPVLPRGDITVYRVAALWRFQ